MIQYEIKISGKVQGVGFRYFTKKRANEFELKGWVKNTVDRGVLVMVQGDETVVDTFIDHLKMGPSLSRVDKISKAKMQITKEFSDFKVVF
jgi:acylphosphatase